MVPRAALASTISHRARVLLWWGGLRGALTLLLALSVTETDAVPEAARTFVAVLAVSTLVLRGADVYYFKNVVEPPAVAEAASGPDVADELALANAIARSHHYARHVTVASAVVLGVVEDDGIAEIASRPGKRHFAR